ncbi:phytoene/squalene synthase family protein [Microcella alkaliphila]|uniref:Bifunctional enzyme phytoene desaturase/synthetase n=1 Tax=Microcella alkaliphila TaxID=279828 RepID=A0A0U4WSY8_9MICO|nr:phytoene/squalene synthase family protein [Microcella alkaliphila]BAU31016.1 bifunctional enzyme phytoene desaturase/synthetase [Microcella alkaliphila]
MTEMRLSLYDRVADEIAGRVIRRYSTSFGLASRLLEPGVRQHVENIYALVRVADEIVDGGVAEAGLDTAAAGRYLDEFEADTEQAIRTGYSTNLVVHAFARTARETGFGTELTKPFFHSMRMDLTDTEHDQESFDTYVYGSAEVVGLMCLRAFLQDHPVTDDQNERMVRGARALGAAFQKANFLRDLAADVETLGRSYFPGIRVDQFTEQEKHRLLDDIDDDLRVSAAVIPELPAGSRRAVALAQSLFQELGERIRRTPAETLIRARISVPTAVKARLLAQAAAGRTPRPPKPAPASAIGASA